MKRRKSTARKLQNAESLNRARSGSSSNDSLVVSSFSALGYADIRPRENVLTYRAWQAAGRQVRKGEKGVPLPVFVPYKGKGENPDSVPASASDGKKSKPRMARKTATVFHIDQTDPIGTPAQDEPRPVLEIAPADPIAPETPAPPARMETGALFG